MLKNSKFQAAIVLAVGALLGYLAATSGLRVTWRAEAAPLSTQTASRPVNSTPAPVKPGEMPTGACCMGGTNKDNSFVNQQQPKGSGKKPNIVFIMGDDIGMWNIGAYHRGLMAGRTPNLDKLAKEGMLFTDYYAEAS